MNTPEIQTPDYKRYLVFGFICLLLTGITSGVTSTWLGDAGKLLLLLCALYSFGIFLGIVRPPKFLTPDDDQ
ncbi:MAG: hypothetical protein ACOYY3_06705 [Chloroflexota bacterium]